MRQILHEIRPELGDCELKMHFMRELEDPAVFENRLDSSVRQDREKGSTSFGPHLDDFEFSCGGKNLRIYGSRGQLRMVSFALKLGCFEILNSSSSQPGKTIVIVDDATGDLDLRAKSAFYEKIQSAGQIFYAFAGADHCETLENAQVFSVAAGKVEI